MDAEKKILIGLAAICSHAVIASPLQQSFSVDAGVEYDTNPTMAATNARGAWVSTVTPEYAVRYVDGTDEWNASVSMDIERSSEQTLVINRNDPTLTLGWERAIPRGSVAVNAEYDQASTSSTETASSGAAGSTDTRNHYGFGGGLEYALTERMQADISIDYDFYSYETTSGLTSAYGDYSTRTAMATVEYLLTERNAVYASVGAVKYTPDTPGVDPTNNYTAVVGVRTELTPQIAVDSNVGVSHLDTDESPTNLTGSTSVTYTGERVESSLTYSRTSASSGAGGFSETDNVSASVDYALDDKTTVGAEASYSQTVEDEPTSTSSLRLHADREVFEELTATAAYEYRQQEDATSEATGSTWMLSLSYDMPDL